MSYGQYTNPDGAYKADNGKGYLPRAVPTHRTVPTPRVEEFKELLALRDGIGDYHVNHFIGYFHLSPVEGADLASLTRRFYRRFCPIFSARNIAEATTGERKFKGLDTVKFQIGGNLGDLLDQGLGLLHQDWVSMQMDRTGTSFYATTLRRLWLEPWERLFLAFPVNPLMPALTPFPLSPEKKAEAITTNQHHFLAGRRSWRLGYDAELNLYFVDTATIERSSREEYRILEETGSLRKDIIALWTHLVENFVEDIQAKLIETDFPDGYTVQNDVAYRLGSHKHLTEVFSDPWFSKIIEGHRSLVRNLQ